MGYNTKQQDAILSVLKSTKGKHITADEIYLKLIHQGKAVGKTTIYRHLEKLTADGTVRRFATGDNSGACYQLSSSHCNEHYHLKCSECGKLIHVECDFLDELAKHLMTDHSFELDKCKTVLYGKCKDCREGKEE
ncbi:MAG: transcriptional repressor [Ruminococcaceae bacterium]|jgi:Fur family ferric uptake transcriptional regulator|nr:transcriptional repressor [Oscillospiraceae bacterium]